MTVAAVVYLAYYLLRPPPQVPKPVRVPVSVKF